MTTHEFERDGNPIRSIDLTENSNVGTGLTGLSHRRPPVMGFGNVMWSGYQPARVADTVQSLAA